MRSRKSAVSGRASSKRGPAARGPPGLPRARGVFRALFFVVAMGFPPTVGTAPPRVQGQRAPPCPEHALPRARKPRPLRQSRSEEHTSELQSLMRISYAVFCLKKKKTEKHINNNPANH